MKRNKIPATTAKVKAQAQAATTTTKRAAPLLAAAEALLDAKDHQMETPAEWRALRRAARQARKQQRR